MKNKLLYTLLLISILSIQASAQTTGSKPDQILPDGFNNTGIEFIDGKPEYILPSVHTSDLDRQFFNLNPGYMMPDKNEGNLPDPFTTINDFLSPTMSVFPNPASDKLHIKFQDDHEYDLRVVNWEGKEVISAEGYESNTTINISSLPSGLYMVILYDGVNTIVKQFVKE